MRWASSLGYPALMNLTKFLPTRVLLATGISIALLSACSPTALPTLDISPAGPLILEAGGPVVDLTATVANSTADVNWELTGPGALLPKKGLKVSYTPPLNSGINPVAGVSIKATLGDTTVTKTLQITFKTPIAPATLNIIAPSQAIVFNTEKVAFNAQVTGSTDTVEWSLAGTGDIGSIDPVKGLTTLYTPPLSGTANKSVVLKAKLGTLEKTFPFDVLLPTLTLTPALTTLDAGLEQVFTSAVNNRDNAAATVWKLEGVGALDKTTGSSVKYTAPNPTTVLADQAVKLTATLSGSSKVMTFNVKPTLKILTLTPDKTTLIAGQAGIKIKLQRTLLADGAAVSFSVDPALKGGNISVIDANTYLYTPPAVADVPTGTTTTVTVNFTVDGISKSVIFTIKPLPKLFLSASSSSVNAGTATPIILTATRVELDGSKPITYTITSVTPALPAVVTGNTLTPAAAPSNTAEYAIPSSVTADTKVLITASTGTAPEDASATLELTIKKP
jgi:hypothetical protein